MKKEKSLFSKRYAGFGLVEVLIVATATVSVVAGGAIMYEKYSNNQELSERSKITSQQMKLFTEATYKYVSQYPNLTDDTITVSELRHDGFLSDSFSAETPYGQEIKGFVLEKLSDPDMYDILISTTGEPEEAFVERTGKEKESFKVNQDKTYHALRREKIEVDNSYYIGKVENDEFFVDGHIIERDVSRFSSFLTSEQQVAVLLESPAYNPTITMEVRAIQASPTNNIPANNSASSTVTLSARYSDGKPVKGERILWSANRGSLSNTSSITNNNGLATTSIKSNSAGNSKIIGRIEDNSETDNVTVSFVNPDIGSFSASPTSNLNADNSMCSNLKVSAAYPDGTKAVNESIQWSASLGTLRSAQNKTNSNGEATACLTSGNAGASTVKVRTSRSGDSATKSIQFVGGSIQNGHMWVSRSSGIPANGSASSKITVRVTYPDGSRVAGETIRWSKNKGWLNTYTTTTNSNGESSVWLKSNQSGSARVTAQVESGQSRSVTVGFDAARVVSIWANKTSNIPADNSSRATVYARVQYPDGTKAKGQNVYWGKSRGSLDHGATKTNNSGVATNRIRSGSAGTSRVTASYGGTSKSINIGFKNQYLYDFMMTVGYDVDKGWDWEDHMYGFEGNGMPQYGLYPFGSVSPRSQGGGRIDSFYWVNPDTRGSGGTYYLIIKITNRNIEGKKVTFHGYGTITYKGNKTKMPWKISKGKKVRVTISN